MRERWGKGGGEGSPCSLKSTEISAGQEHLGIVFDLTLADLSNDLDLPGHQGNSRCVQCSEVTQTSVERTLCIDVRVNRHLLFPNELDTFGSEFVRYLLAWCLLNTNKALFIPLKRASSDIYLSNDVAFCEDLSSYVFLLLDVTGTSTTKVLPWMYTSTEIHSFKRFDTLPLYLCELQWLDVTRSPAKRKKQHHDQDSYKRGKNTRTE